MTLQEIKEAIDKGLTVNWCNPGYEVQKYSDKTYLIKWIHEPVNYIGLTNLAGDKLNGKEKQFFVKVPTSQAQVKQYEQTTNKLQTAIKHLSDLLDDIPKKGTCPSECKKTELWNYLAGIKEAAEDLNMSDFISNEYSGEFMYSYS